MKFNLYKTIKWIKRAAYTFVTVVALYALTQGELYFGLGVLIVLFVAWLLSDVLS